MAGFLLSAQIRKWAASMPVAALTDKQHIELEQLFEIYDTDGSGTVVSSMLPAAAAAAAARPPPLCGAVSVAHTPCPFLRASVA